jgi:hypothetical protein
LILHHDWWWHRQTVSSLSTNSRMTARVFLGVHSGPPEPCEPDCGHLGYVNQTASLLMRTHDTPRTKTATKATRSKNITVAAITTKITATQRNDSIHLPSTPPACLQRSDATSLSVPPSLNLSFPVQSPVALSNRPSSCNPSPTSPSGNLCTAATEAAEARNSSRNLAALSLQPHRMERVENE